jgi:hypothetical protein
MLDPITGYRIINEIADTVQEKIQEGKKAGYTDEDTAITLRQKEEAEEILRRSGEISFLIVGKSGVGKSEWLERMQGREPRPSEYRSRTEEITEMIAVFPYKSDRIIIKKMGDVPGEEQDDWLAFFIESQPDGIIFMIDSPSIIDFDEHKEALSFVIDNMLNYQSKLGIFKGWLDNHYKALQNLKVLAFVVNTRGYKTENNSLPEDIRSAFYKELRDLEQLVLKINLKNVYFEYCVNAIEDSKEDVLRFNLEFFSKIVQR